MTDHTYIIKFSEDECRTLDAEAFATKFLLAAYRAANDLWHPGMDALMNDPEAGAGFAHKFKGYF